MKKSIPYSLIAVACVVLAGCDRCSKKDEPAATTAAIDQPQPTVTDPAAATQPVAADPAPAPAPETPTSDTPTEKAADSKEEVSDGKLKITDVKIGKGAVAKEGKKVSVFYTGTLTNGTKFDSTKDRNTPFSFVLGSGMVIAGWDQGVKGMKEGGTRKLVIPASLAYGSRSVGGVIPPNSTLLFEIELLKVE